MTTQDIKKSASKISAHDIKKSVSELYSVAREKLQKLKEELENVKSNYEEQKAITEQKEVQYNELLEEVATLNLMLKGAEERYITTQASKSAITKQKSILEEEIEKINAYSELLVTTSKEKVKSVEDSRKVIVSRIQKVRNTLSGTLEKIKTQNEELKIKIKDAENECTKIRQELDEKDSNESRKNEALIEESNKMKKFLSEL